MEWTRLRALGGDRVVATLGLAGALLATSGGAAIAQSSGSASETPRAGGLEGPRVLWIDAARSVPVGLDEAIREASGILASAGLHYHHRQAEPTTETDSSASTIRLVVLPRSPIPSTAGKLVMGSVRAERFRAGEPLAVWVYVEPVLAVLGLRLAVEDPSAFARALGRVVAHEIIHLSVPHLDHSAEGLMAASLSAQELRRKDIDLDPRFRAALRALAEAGTAKDVAVVQHAPRAPDSAPR